MEKKWPDCNVTEPRSCLFLKEVVFRRGNTQKRPVFIDITGATVPNRVRVDGKLVPNPAVVSFVERPLLVAAHTIDPVPVGEETYLAYVKALVDLWRKQFPDGGPPHPRGEILKKQIEVVRQTR